MSIYDELDRRAIADATTAVAAPPLGCREAEAAVLGAAMLAPARAGDVLGDLAPADLVDPRHRKVLAAILALLADGVEPDPVAVLGQLRRTGAVPAADDPGAGKLLADLVAACPSPSSAGHYRRAILEDALRRYTVAAFARVQQAAEGESLVHLVALVHGEVATLGTAMRRAGVAAPSAVTR